MKRAHDGESSDAPPKSTPRLLADTSVQPEHAAVPMNPIPAAQVMVNLPHGAPSMMMTHESLNIPVASASAKQAETMASSKMAPVAAAVPVQVTPQQASFPILVLLPFSSPCRMGLIFQALTRMRRAYPSRYERNLKLHLSHGPLRLGKSTCAPSSLCMWPRTHNLLGASVPVTVSLSALSCMCCSIAPRVPAVASKAEPQTGRSVQAVADARLLDMKKEATPLKPGQDASLMVRGTVCNSLCHSSHGCTRRQRVIFALKMRCHTWTRFDNGPTVLSSIHLQLGERDV